MQPSPDASPAAGRVLFSPVSGPNGAGELMRCLIIARELRRADPSLDIRFLVSRTAVFRETVEFPIFDCDASPTNSTPQVLAAIESFRPHVVVFDNSGRTEQLRAAKAAGARLVYSSRAPKQRRKAFRLKWLRLLDEHWIVFPTFVTGDFSWLEKLKLRLFPAHRVRRLDTLFPPSEPGARRAWLAARGLVPGAYTAFVPGGRGEAQRTIDPPRLFTDAARSYVGQAGAVGVVLTGRPGAAADSGDPQLVLLPRIGPDEVQHLLADAELVVCNGGTSMVHALAHGRPLVTVPLASDQGRRIRRADRLGIAIRASHDPAEIAAQAAALRADPAARASLQRRIAELGLANGVGEAVAALRELVRAAQDARRQPAA